MRFLIIGLGSMGKRRVRNLLTLGYKDITGFDTRDDRRKEAKSKYGITTVKDLPSNFFQAVDAIIISTPPDKHESCIKICIKYLKPCFVEASVVLGNLPELNRLAKKKNILIAPSCTLRFHSAIKTIDKIIKNGSCGRITNFTYHSGQYLPDWHPWEKVKDFYVSKKETGGAREIVPYELTWIVDLVGYPQKVVGFHGRTMDVGADIDDTYVLAMKFAKNTYGILNIDVVSRYSTRSLILNMEYGQILWRWDENTVKLFDAKKQRWINHYYAQGEAAEGYNKNINEKMYVDELSAFIKAVKGKNKFPNTLDEDIRILRLLEKAEKNNG